MWLAATVALMLLVPPPDPTAGQMTDLLPATTPFHRAVEELSRRFGEKSALSQIVVVFERPESPLTPKDLDDVERVAEMLGQPLSGESRPEEFCNVSVQTPKSLSLLGKTNPLISSDGHAALAFASLPYSFLSTQAARMVNHTQAVLADYRFVGGLTTAITGSAGYGHDYSLANERSHRKTILVTLAAVIVILLLVYRAPVAAMIPLAAIGMAAVVATKLLLLGESLGLQGGTAERIFVFVLLYGAGVDYSLLLISRTREFLDEGYCPSAAVIHGLDASGTTILSSTATTAAGVGMLCFANFVIFRNTGPAVVLALLTAAAASITLVPAMMAIIGPQAFWPRRWRPPPSEAVGGAETNAGLSPSIPPKHGRLWPKLARLVTTKPGMVLMVMLAALIIPAVKGSSLTWVYDSQSSLKPTYDAVRGAEMVKGHWPVGEIAPITVLAAADQPQPVTVWMSACAKILEGLRSVQDVDNVRSLTTPAGLHTSPFDNGAVLLFAGDKVRTEFLSPDRRAMRLSVVLRCPPLTLAAMDDVARIQSSARHALAQTNVKAQVYMAGATAEMVDIRTVTQGDFYRVAVLSLGMLLVIVVALLRDLMLSVFMVAATVLSYLATLGLTHWIFSMLGQSGLDWKVQMFLFIVMVAVGQDYNLFFAVRLVQEARRLPPALAAEQALVHTGPVISSCGVIMAATLGSVMAGDVTMLVQLGFAFALGMLIDTFVVRPLLLPAFIVLTKRTLKKAASFL